MACDCLIIRVLESTWLRDNGIYLMILHLIISRKIRFQKACSNPSLCHDIGKPSCRMTVRDNKYLILNRNVFISINKMEFTLFDIEQDMVINRGIGWFIRGHVHRNKRADIVRMYIYYNLFSSWSRLSLLLWNISRDVLMITGSRQSGESRQIQHGVIGNMRHNFFPICTTVKLSRKYYFLQHYIVRVFM